MAARFPLRSRFGPDENAWVFAVYSLFAADLVRRILRSELYYIAICTCQALKAEPRPNVKRVKAS